MIMTAESASVSRLGANDPYSDLVYFGLLMCPNTSETVVIEHVSGADVYSEESAHVIPDVPHARRATLKREVVKWISL
jgi:hypothetical protein